VGAKSDRGPSRCSYVYLGIYLGIVLGIVVGRSPAEGRR
jgi:hypothetical protein